MINDRNIVILQIFHLTSLAFFYEYSKATIFFSLSLAMIEFYNMVKYQKKISMNTVEYLDSFLNEITVKMTIFYMKF